MTLKSVADKYGFKVEARVAAEGDDAAIVKVAKFFDSPENMTVLFCEIIDSTNSYAIVNQLQHHEDALCCIDVRGRLQLAVPCAGRGNKLDEITLCEAMLSLRSQYEADQIYLARLPGTSYASPSFIAATYDLHASVDGDATAKTAEVVGEHMVKALRKSSRLLDEFSKLMQDED